MRFSYVPLGSPSGAVCRDESDEYLAGVEAENPETFSPEFLALFESGGDVFFDRSRFEPVDGLGFADPDQGVNWIAGLDPGFSVDGFGLALVGQNPSRPGQPVLGPVMALKAERAPIRRGRRVTWSFERKRGAEDRLLERVAEICQEYDAHAVVDQHLSQAIIDRLGKHGVHAQLRAMTGGQAGTKYAVFRELRDRIYDATLPLPRHEDLLRELLAVRFKLGETGVRIILPRTAGGHCDMAQALALAVHERRFVRSGKRRPISGPGTIAGNLLAGGEPGERAEPAEIPERPAPTKNQEWKFRRRGRGSALGSGSRQVRALMAARSTPEQRWERWHRVHELHAAGVSNAAIAGSCI